jgi:hypothetical protein
MSQVTKLDEYKKLFALNEIDPSLAGILSLNGAANLTVCPECLVDDFVHVQGCCVGNELDPDEDEDGGDDLEDEADLPPDYKHLKAFHDELFDLLTEQGCGLYFDHVELELTADLDTGEFVINDYNSKEVLRTEDGLAALRRMRE